MRYRVSVTVLAASLALSAPAIAGETEDRDALSRIEPQMLFQGMIREGDIDLLFDQLRQAMLAAAEGRDAPPSAALEARAAELGVELRLRGTLAGLVLLNALESNARQMLREAVPPPSQQHLLPSMPLAIPAQY